MCWFWRFFVCLFGAVDVRHCFFLRNIQTIKVAGSTWWIKHHFSNMNKIKTPLLIPAKVWLKQKVGPLRFFFPCSCCGKPSWGFTLLSGIGTLIWGHFVTAAAPAEVLSPSQSYLHYVSVGETVLVKDNVLFSCF